MEVFWSNTGNVSAGLIAAAATGAMAGRAGSRQAGGKTLITKTRNPTAIRWGVVFLIVAAVVLVLAYVYNRGRKKGGRIIDVDAEFIDPGFDYDAFVDELNANISGWSVVTDFGHFGLIALLDKMIDSMNADEWRLIYNKYNLKYGNLGKNPAQTLVTDVKDEWFTGVSKIQWLNRAELWLK